MIYLATDWHLWKYNKKLKQCVKNPHFDSILRNAQATLADDDILLYLGDFTDDEMKNEKKLVGVLDKIPGYKILVKGNNDTMSDSAYLAAGFDRVVEIAILGNIIFTHHPIYVGPGQLNVHGHNHGKFNPFATRQNIDIYTKDGELIPLDEALRHKQPDFRIPIRGKFWREAHPKHYVTHGRIFDLEEYYRNGVDGIPVDESVFRKDVELEIGDFLDSIEEQTTPQEEKEAYLNKIKYLAESYFTGESIRPMNEMLEFKVGNHPKPDHGMIMLFHGTPENVNRIEPVSRNVGTRFSKPRTSSFWASRYEVAQVMGIWRLLANKMWPLSPEEKVSFYIDFRKNKYVIPKSDVAKLDKLLKGETLYIYLATVPEKYVGKGHDPDVDEYSVDLTVVPHNRIAIKNLNHKFAAFEVLPDAEYQRNVAFYGNVKGRKLPIRDRLIYHSNFRKNAAALNDKFKDAREYGLQSFRGAFSESVDDIIDEVLFQNFEDTKDFEEDDDVARRHQDPYYQPTYRVRFRKRQKQSKDELPNNADSIDESTSFIAESSIIDLTLPLMQPEMSDALEKMRKRMQDETNTKPSCIEEAARVKYVRLIRKGEFDNARRKAKAKREKDPLRTSGPFEGALKSVSIDEKNSMIIIKGINFQKLMARIKNMYDTKKVNNLFDPTYSKWTLYLYNTEQISKSEMKIVDVRVPLFFALELQQIFYDLSDYYQLKYYEEIGDLIYKKTWVSNVDKPVQRTEVDVDGALKKFTLEPLPYQLGYMQEYFNITRRFNFDGHILTFKPGYGKTFTATLIAEAAPDVDQVVVVCPNTLKENWANEVKSYYKKYTNQKTFSEEVFVSGNARYKFNKQKAKWIIVNQESIPMVFDKVAKKNVMIIVDECQYFRNYETKRVKDLLQLKEITNATEVLMMSGTPIHATPDEALPALLMIDPMMTLDLAKKYKSAFSVDNTYLERVINARMGIVMYDVPSEVLKLPAKTVTSLKLPLKNDKKFLLYNVEAEISARYKKYYAELGVDADKYKVQFHEILRKYSSADKTLTKNYIDFVDAGSNYLTVHESKSTIYRTFLKTYVYPNIPDNEMPQVKETMANYVYMSAKARGLAQGEVYPPLYNKVNISLWDEHEDEFIDRIQNNLKKTLIFTPYVSVANHIEERLDARKIGVIKITGSVVKNRMDMINAFRNSDDIEVLVATYNVAGTGLTLIEASQVFFFGVPYRSADFDQAADRVYRIGQTSDVFIYKVLLQSSVANAKNITERQDEIMEWSRSMSNAYTKGAKTQIEFDFDDIPVDESATAIQRANAYWGEDNPEPFFGKESYNNKWDDAYDDAYDDDSVTFDESLITPIDYVPDFNDSVNEASSGKLYPVYVMLMHSGTALSTAISFVTKSNFSHSSISFDASMSNMYSFGRKFDTNPFIGTFKKEDIHSNFFTQKKIPYALYVVPVTADELARMQKRLDYFIKNSTKFKYDFVGLFKNYLGIVDNPEYKWFCSRFVADILNAGQPTSPHIKHPNLVKPKDFAKMSFAKYVTGGLLQDYDQKEVETIAAKILADEEKKRLLNVNESWEDSLPTDVDGGDAEHIDGTKKDFMTASDPLIGDVWDDYDKPITGKGMSESNLQPLSDRQAVIIPISSNGKLYYQAEDLRFFAAWLEDMYRSVIYQMIYAEVDAKSLAQIKLIIGWMMKFILHADVNVSDYNKQGAQETIDTAEKLLKLCAKRYHEIGINWNYVNSVVDPIYNEYKKKLEDLEIVDLALGKQAIVIEIP